MPFLAARYKAFEVVIQHVLSPQIQHEFVNKALIEALTTKGTGIPDSDSSHYYTNLVMDEGECCKQTKVEEQYEVTTLRTPFAYFSLSTL